MGTWMEGVIYDKPRANGDNIVGCYTLSPFVHPVACCCALLGVLSQCLKLVKLLAPCKPTQHCWPRFVRPFALSYRFAS